MTEQMLKEAFYWFHQNPELSYEEYKTTAKIRELLEKEGIEILPCKLETGLAAVIRGLCRRCAVISTRCLSGRNPAFPTAPSVRGKCMHAAMISISRRGSAQP